jgi:mannose-6-phosphate isomerase-like protein (cupin superfamily)
MESSRNNGLPQFRTEDARGFPSRNPDFRRGAILLFEDHYEWGDVMEPGNLTGQSDNRAASANAYSVVSLQDIAPAACPCGQARRAFADAHDQAPASIHWVEISADAKTHYHKWHTEIYYILQEEGEASLELNGDRIPVQKGDAILIHPGCRHRALGKMTILNVVIPPFDPSDEWIDE